MAHETMGELILHKKDLKDFFERLTADFVVYGPSKDGHEEAVVPIKVFTDLDIDHHHARMSPKNQFFPHTEEMFSFDVTTKGSPADGKQAATREQPRVLFAIRPCDARAIWLVDRVFVEEGVKDPYYARRRNKTLVISFACPDPGAACFCSSVGCGPDSETGADLVFTELKDRYHVKKITEQGAQVLDTAGAKVSPATDEDREEKKGIMDRAREKLGKAFDIGALTRKIEDFEADHWETLHQKCLGCGVCTYFCPTCHCFDITDEIMKTQGRRVRTWDSCMFRLFTLHASGHNPRPAIKQRMRQRLMHKFNYALKNTGQVFCVGCGRCVNNCPVNLDIRTVLKEMAGEE